MYGSRNLIEFDEGGNLLLEILGLGASQDKSREQTIQPNLIPTYTHTLMWPCRHQAALHRTQGKTSSASFGCFAAFESSQE